ncbi:MAG: DUF3516 domain-containing protein [Myxococcales bacterium]|nr:DUF3516 domain-containing protein [Myxococcales bacterium]
MTRERRLHEFLPAAQDTAEEFILEAFLDWVTGTGLEPYPEQETAILELLAGHHVVLSTPTGSGKSLVALALHFQGLCEGRRSFYTAPVKALVSEKFFQLCEQLGAERVGMLTGDASVNPGARVICCTTEVLANMALRAGEDTDAPYVVLDEFHYYGDRDRGVAWQVPLISLPRTLFLMMSATLGNTAAIEERLRAYTGREVVHIHSDERPVPLDFSYRETSLHETIQELHEGGRAPIYVVGFTQRACAELAQGLTSLSLCGREEKRHLAGLLGDFRFDTPYGKDLKRILGHGIGVHHAGLLPRYRLLVERLAGKGLLSVICGTDTLGVGVNIPIRSVLFSGLSKYDGEKVGILTARDFKQIAGRAGRKGFDDRGSVVCQAPEHVVINKRLAEKASRGGKAPRKKSPPRGFVAWNQKTFDDLVSRAPEPLTSRFQLSHGMLLALLQRPPGGSYRDVISTISRCHERERGKRRLRVDAATLLRSLRRAELVEVTKSSEVGARLQVAEELQSDFSLHQTLSLYLVEALTALDPDAPSYPLEVLSLVEAIQDDPRPILNAQTRKARDELFARLKAEGVEYEERIRRVQEVSYEQPEATFIAESLALFAASHPWVDARDARPKSIARALFESYRGFVDYVSEYSLARCEGLLLRYLSQVHNTLVKTIPDDYKTEGIYDAIAFLRTLLRIDDSLMEAWQDLAEPGDIDEAEPAPDAPFDLAQHPAALRARARSELLALVRALAQGDFEEALTLFRHDPAQPWSAGEIEESLAPYFERYGEILFTPEARQAHQSQLSAEGSRFWRVSQVLVDPEGDRLWALHGEIDLRDAHDPQGPLFTLRRIGP